MSNSMKLAEYLFARLRQLGIRSIHGVPGDFNLTLLDYVEPAGLRWVGNANELNAAYAADAYARIKGLGAVITTFGVGELSAVNAIAGAYAERAPVVHIVGIPARELQDRRSLIHHTFNDGEFERFAQIHAHITVAQTRLWDPRTSPQQIDETLMQCIRHSRPVYIEVPVDLVSSVVSTERLARQLETHQPGPKSVLDDVFDRIKKEISSAKQPIIIADGEIRPMGIVHEVDEFVKQTQWPTWTSPFGKGLLDETVANFHGIYQGIFGDSRSQEFVHSSDLILCFGPHFSSTNTSGHSSVPKSEVTILFRDTEIEIRGQVYRDAPAKDIVTQLIKDIANDKTKKYIQYPELPRDFSVDFSDIPGDQPLAQDRLWRVLSKILRPGDIILGETGTAGYGVREMALPKYVRVFTPVTWLSIGYMLPGSQGAALAQQDLIEESKYPDGIQDPRTILLIGDGSFQMTVQELGTIVRHNLNIIIFLLNNDGYTIERCIHGRNQIYNDIPSWRYLQAPSFFGASEDAYTASAKTYADLEAVLSHDQIKNGKGLRMVELVVDREDAPKGPLSSYLEKQKALQSDKKLTNGEI